MALHHGIEVFEPVEGIRALKAASTAAIGLLAFSADANADAFPLNKPVLVTDIRQAIADAGNDGTLKRSLEAIADQVNPVLVVVRIDKGADQNETDANAIGDFTRNGYTGMKAFLAAEQQLSVRPSIFVALGLDTQPVTADLVAVARQQRGFCYARAIGDDVVAASSYRANFGQRELMLIWPDTAAGWTGDAVARAAGLRARIDKEVGWHKTLSNIAVDGITGTSKDVFHNVLDNNTDAGILNTNDVTALIQMNGFRFWGNRTCSDEPKFAFESAVRTSQALQNTIANGLIWAIDKPITGALVRDIVETINAEFSRLVTAGRIIGGKAWFDPASNPADQLAAGRIVIDYDYTPAAPAEALTLNQRITDKYYADLSVAA